MSIGDGIAILGLWSFAGACALSPTVSNSAYWTALLLVSVFTLGVMAGA